MTPAADASPTSEVTSSDPPRPLDGVGSADILHCLVMLGTDHHPFARLVGWVDRWAADHPDARCLVQHGPAAPPRHAEGRPVLDPAEIPGLVARARVVVGHAGPGTVLDARAGGRRPVIVPRLAHLGEVVDDHQVAFGRWMDQRGQATCVEDEAALRSHLDAALADPAAYAIHDHGDGREGAVAPAVTLFGELVDGMLRR